MSAQIEITKKNQSLSQRQTEILAAADQIRNLKNGYLLVRLQTRSKSIETIRSNGYEKKADEMEAKMEEQNKTIAMAFGTNIDFCKTLFFYSDDSDKILSKDLQQIDFMDSGLNPLPHSLDSNTYFLVLDLNTLKERDAKFDTYRQEPTEKGIENKSVNYASSNLNLPAFIVKDQNLNQLTDPFPYYVRAYDLNPRPKRIFKAAIKLNTKLWKFYKKS